MHYGCDYLQSVRLPGYIAVITNPEAVLRLSLVHTVRWLG